MEPSSQMFTQGGIRMRDWFSERLHVDGQAEARAEDAEERVVKGERSVEGKVAGEAVQALPVESVAHLDGDQHRQGHGHGLRGLKDLTLHTLKVGVVLSALHEVGLQGEGGKTGVPWKPPGHPAPLRPPSSVLPYQLVVADMRPVIRI